MCRGPQFAGALPLRSLQGPQAYCQIRIPRHCPSLQVGKHATLLQQNARGRNQGAGTQPKAAASEGSSVSHLTLQALEDMESERRWVAGVLRVWLDEEWTPLDCHRLIGDAVAEIYIRERASGEDDIGSIILSIGTELIGDDIWRESFTDSFGVANKLAEFLMLRMDTEVCCTDEDAKSELKRYTELAEAEQP